MPATVTRFAPSPTGLLHLGHAHAALFAWRTARQPGGRFLLRLEDIDTARCRPEYASATLADLAWLGLDWHDAVRVQSAHFSDFQAVLDSLAVRGLLYPCFCTRAEIAASASAPHGPEGQVYPGTCRALASDHRAARQAAGQPFALRLNMAAALRAVPFPLFFDEAGIGRLRCDPAAFGDVVLARKDIPASYHLCVCHDDAVQGVTLVTRGEDLKQATELHRLLQELCGWPAPRYAHHKLLLGTDGRRLSKRDGAPTLQSLREAGHSPAHIRALAGFPD